MPEPWEYLVTKRVLAKQEFPSGPFDPERTWRHSYDIYFMNVRMKRGNSGKRPLTPAASVDVRSAPDGGNVRLQITYTAQMDGDKTVTKATCRNDSLLPPIAWTQSFTNATGPGKGLVDFTKKGEVRDGTLLLDGREPSSASWKLGTYTADWCLLDAVQRLALKADTGKHSFDLIEEFAMLRRKQVLLHRGTSKVATPNGEIPAQVYCHYGESVIPTLYYIDADNRLFLAVSTRRTIILREEV